MPSGSVLHSPKSLLLVVTLSLTVVSRLGAADVETASWTSFRGGKASGYLPGRTIPERWTDEDYRWRCPLPGGGVGSAVADAKHAYLLTADNESRERRLVAIDLVDGKIRWEYRFPLAPHGIHARNSFASSTPCLDQRGIYVAFADPQRVTLAAISHVGELLWERDLGAMQSEHGFATSPVLLADRLILFLEQQGEQLQPGEAPGQSRMMAFDPKTGRTLWKAALTTTRVCYGVPLGRSGADGVEEIVAANTGDGIFAVRADDGRMRWRLPVFTARCVSSPLEVQGVLIGSAGSGGGGNHLVAVRPPKISSQDEGESAPQAASEVYRIERNAPYVPTPAVVGEDLLMVDDRGIASRVEGATGRVLWSARVGGNYSASPVVVGDKMLVITLDGEARVIDLQGEPPRVGEAFSLGGPVQATPSVCAGGLLLRIGESLCCLETSAMSSQQ